MRIHSAKLLNILRWQRWAERVLNHSIAPGLNVIHSAKLYMFVCDCRDGPNGSFIFEREEDKEQEAAVGAGSRGGLGEGGGVGSREERASPREEVSSSINKRRTTTRRTEQKENIING